MPRSHEDDGHERHGSVAGAAWIFLAIVTALIVVTGVYRWDHNRPAGTRTSAVGAAIGPAASGKAHV
ncbi:MAG TPA: hypothetical protein VFW23_15510, partial [Tepidisphaeraceae bacterium]|nr:hypothetical protein [Tepidisphaeraceae bacterium]